MSNDILFLQIYVAVLGFMFITLAIMLDVLRRKIKGEIHFFLHMTTHLLEGLVKAMSKEPDSPKPEQPEPNIKEKEKISDKVCDACGAKIMRNEKFVHFHKTNTDYCQKCREGGKIIMNDKITK